MGKLITNNGKEFDCSVAEISPTLHILYLVFPTLGVRDVANIFLDDEETKKLTYYPPNKEETEKEFNDYKILVDIVPEPYGTRIGMRQPYLDEVAKDGD